MTPPTGIHCGKIILNMRAGRLVQGIILHNRKDFQLIYTGMPTLEEAEGSGAGGGSQEFDPVWKSFTVGAGLMDWITL